MTSLWSTHNLRALIPVTSIAIICQIGKLAKLAKPWQLVVVISSFNHQGNYGYADGDWFGLGYGRQKAPAA